MTFSLFNEKPTRELSEFEFLQDPKDKKNLLGVGSFATVKLALEKSSNKLVALKMVKLENSKNRANDLHNLRTEVSVHSRIEHPNIIKFRGYAQEGTTIYIVLDYAERGNLYSYIHKKKVLTNEEIFRFFYQTCLAIQEVHKNDVMHRDIKPENLLLDEDLNIKLCDFGWSAERIREKRTTLCGTYEYMAPEIIYKRPYDYRIDTWSLGILLYELIHKEAPYKGRSLTEICNSISKGPFTFCSSIDPQARDLILKILKVNPQERPSISQILSHSWVQGQLETSSSFRTLPEKQFYSQGKENLKSRPVSQEKAKFDREQHGRTRKPSNLTGIQYTQPEVERIKVLDDLTQDWSVKNQSKVSCSLAKAKSDSGFEPNKLVRDENYQSRKVYNSRILSSNQKQSIQNISSPTNSTPTMDRMLLYEAPQNVSSPSVTSIPNFPSLSTSEGHGNPQYPFPSITKSMSGALNNLSSAYSQQVYSSTRISDVSQSSNLMDSSLAASSQKQRNFAHPHLLMNSRPLESRSFVSPLISIYGPSTTTRAANHQKTLTGISEAGYSRRLFTEVQPATPQSHLIEKGSRLLISPRFQEFSAFTKGGNQKVTGHGVGSLVSPVAWPRRRIVSRNKTNVIRLDHQQGTETRVLGSFNQFENIPTKSGVVLNDSELNRDKKFGAISFSGFVTGNEFKSKLIQKPGDVNRTKVLRPFTREKRGLANNKENRNYECESLEKHNPNFYSEIEQFSQI